MWFSSWLRNRTVSRKPRPASRFRPALEMLEDRCVPATFTVNTTLDVLRSGHADTTLSLRQAIIDANASATTADTIILPAGNYILTRAGAGEDNCLTGDLDIKGPLTINGAGAGSTVVDAAGLDRVFHTYNYVITLSGMTIQGGNAVSGSFGPNGGGIANPYVGGALTLNNCVVTGNTAAGNGGGITSGGSLTVNNSVISNNRVNSGGWGGGIYNLGTLTVTNSTLSGNAAPGDAWGAGGLGGGIAHVSGAMTIQTSTLSGNSAHTGGAIYFSSTQYYPSSVQNSTFSNNSASQGGGIYARSGNLTVANCTLSGNSASQQGGGIYNNSSILAVTNCTVIGNSASQGGGIYTYSGSVTVSGSTFTGNSATDSGGGIYNTFITRLTISICTFAGNSATNSGGGVFNGSGATLTVRGSTLLDNFAPLGADLYNLGRLFASSSTIGNVIYP